MGVKISQLPGIVTPALSDVFPAVQSGVTYKETGTQLSTLFALAGANSNITSMTGLTGTLQAPTAILDINANKILQFSAVTSAVNYLEIENNISGFSPAILSLGTDTNVGIVFQAQASGTFHFNTGNSSNAITVGTGTNYQHSTQFSFPTDASTKVITWPNATGTVLLTGGTQQLGTGASILLDKLTGTESSHAVTINAQSGVITTTSLTTAQYATETITLTNSEISATSVVLVSICGGSNTTPGITVSATAGSGTSTIVLTNLNSSALNGTVFISFAVF